jgi:hypothetical protein
MLVLFLAGLVFHRPAPHVVPTGGRELRVAEAPVAVYFTLGSTDRVVAHVLPGEAVWVRHFDETEWVAVFAKERSRAVLGFAPDSGFAAGFPFPSAVHTVPSPTWKEKVQVRLFGGDAPRSR